MLKRYLLLMVPVLFAGTIGAGLPVITSAKASECNSGEKIDGSSVGSARAKLEKAGFHSVRDMKKGCDNFWHGTVIRDGQTVHVVLSPQGQAMIEGN